MVSSTKQQTSGLVSVGGLHRRILLVRDCPVMMDSHLADLYGVETKALTRAVRRNSERFPSDFMFQLTKEEWKDLRRQLGTSSATHGGRRYMPLVFSEQGVAMLSSVLRSKRAASVNVEVMRAFVELRRLAGTHEAIGRRIDELERELKARLGKNEAEIGAVLKLLREVTISRGRKRPAGFMPPADRR